ncbi:putative Ig domain-containing protein [Stygiobacter electus]|uniref:Ig domain-containing protein n=1 Tax=Stygiobacter electus TaxID=3032292 RepID=A0AAE3P139_9BACT|nr:putative Ig domain-containing protein [Stygiobacter electus]MDF1611782.1 putative Ig domain-containing protein [Stygiobacter electus]
MNIKNILLISILFSTIAYSQIQVTLPTISGQPDTEQIVGVVVNDLTPYNARGYQMRLKYDKNVIYLMNPNDNSGTLSTGYLSYTNDTRPDSSIIVVVAIAPNEKFTGSGILFKLKVKLLKVGSTTITVDESFNNYFTDGNNNINFTSVSGRATVATTNFPPVFDAVAPKTVNEGQELKFTINAVDPEGAPVTYSVVSKPEGSNFNATTKEFSWTPNYTQAGTYTATFSASDGNSSATLNVSITVVDFNTPPQINAIPDKEINEGQELSFEVKATDNEGDVLTYSATNLPAGANFNPTTHIFSWTPTGKQAGNYAVNFSVSDGKMTSSITVNIKVNDVNVAPTIQPIPDKTVNTGQTLVIDIVANDPDGDNLTYGYTGTLPTGSTFDATSHKFTWKPTANQAGDYQITFFVFDGQLTATTTVKIKVIKVNSAPVFTKIMPDTTIQVHNVQVLFKYQYKATDPDGDVITFKLDNGPEGATMTSNGLFQWIPKVTQAGQSFLVMVTITDGEFSDTKISTLSTDKTIVGVEEIGGIPTKFNLEQNYPNPFNPTTTIKFEIPKESYVRLRVFNSIGKDVAELINKELSVGSYQVNFDASELPSGIYYYKLEANDFTQTRKMLLVK